MIYLWHLFIKWSLAYSMSALVCDIVVSLIFVALFFYGRTKESKK